MKSLNEDLKTGQFKQIYLLYGEENYLKKQYKERFVKAMLPDGDTMNYAYYEGKGVDIKEVIDLAETLPFFAERRLLVFENTGFFKSSGADLADYVKEMPQTTGRKADVGGVGRLLFRKGRNRYAEYPGRTGKAVLLYAAPGCDYTGGH